MELLYLLTLLVSAGFVFRLFFASGVSQPVQYGQRIKAQMVRLLKPSKQNFQTAIDTAHFDETGERVNGKFAFYA